MTNKIGKPPEIAVRHITRTNVSTVFLPLKNGETLSYWCSVDNSTNDNGFLANAKTAWPTGLNHPDPLQHGSIVQAADNLWYVSPTPEGGIEGLVGHGADGFIGLGCGQGQSTADNAIYVGNERNWQGPFSRFSKRKWSMLTLIGCDVGANDPGATLLYEMAQLIGKPVRARTGLVFDNTNGDFSFEANSQWQIATPSSRPNPIPRPAYDIFLADDDLRILLSNGESLTIEDVASIEYRRPSNQAPVLISNIKKIANFLSFIDWLHPLPDIGVPSAMQTGSIILTLNNDENQLVLRIWNDRLIEISSVFYFASSAFSTFLRII